MITLLLIPCYIHSYSQNKPWTFQQCVDTALKRNITVNQSRLTNELNKITLSQTRANRIPGISASISEGVNFGKNIDPTTNSYVVQTYNSTNFGVNGSLNLFNGFQNTHTIQQNTQNIEAGNYDIANAQNTVILNITTAYLQILFANEILAAAQNQAASTASQVERTEKMVNVGKVPESNLFQIKSQFATDKLSVVNAESSLEMSKVTLLQLMETPIIDSFNIVKPEITPPGLMTLQSNHQIYEKALLVQPQVAGAAIRSNNSQLAIKIAQGARYPKLSLSGNVNTNFAGSSRNSSAVNPEDKYFFNQMWNNLGESLGLNLSIPIYSNRQIKSNIERATINSLTAQLNEQNIKNQLRKSIEQTYTDLKNSMKKYEATLEQYNSAEVSYKNTETKYNVGMVTAIDFLVEKNNYIQAQANLIQSKYDYLFKTKILDFYVGTPIRF
ncbi:MAG: TolC family protein [Bacteroidota bacterium]